LFLKGVEHGSSGTTFAYHAKGPGVNTQYFKTTTKTKKKQTKKREKEKIK
jgi:hypothetical protein